MKLNMKVDADEIVLVCQVCIPGNSFGNTKMCRVILVGDFTSKTAARKYNAKLKKFSTKFFANYGIGKITNNNIKCDKYSTFKSYEYVSFGPSTAYTHHHIVLDDINND